MMEMTTITTTKRRTTTTTSRTSTTIFGGLFMFLCMCVCAIATASATATAATQETEEKEQEEDSSNVLSKTKQQTLVWASRLAGILSGCTSLVMIAWIVNYNKNRNDKNKPHQSKVRYYYLQLPMDQQLLLGMTTGTFLAGLAWAFSSLPLDTQELDHHQDLFYGAKGTAATCTAQGFLLQFGGITAVFYVLVLGLCLFLQIRLDWNVQLTTWLGATLTWWLHGFPLSVGTALALAGIPFYQGPGSTPTTDSTFWICYVQGPPAQDTILPSVFFTIIPTGATIIMGGILILPLLLYSYPREEMQAPMATVVNDEEDLDDGDDDDDNDQDLDDEGGQQQEQRRRQGNPTHRPDYYGSVNDKTRGNCNDEDDGMIAHAMQYTEQAVHAHGPSPTPPPATRMMRRGSAVAAPPGYYGQHSLSYQQPQQLPPPQEQQQQQLRAKAMRRGSSVAAPVIVPAHPHPYNPHQNSLDPEFRLQQHYVPAAPRAMRRGSSVAVPAVIPMHHLNPISPSQEQELKQQQQKQQEVAAAAATAKRTRKAAAAAAKAALELELVLTRIKTKEYVGYLVSLALTWPFVALSQILAQHVSDSNNSAYPWWVIVAFLAPLHGFFNSVVFSRFHFLAISVTKKYHIKNSINTVSTTHDAEEAPAPVNEPRSAPSGLHRTSQQHQEQAPSVMAPFDAMMAAGVYPSDRALFLARLPSNQSQNQLSSCAGGVDERDDNPDPNHPFLTRAAPGVFTVNQGHEVRHIHTQESGTDGDWLSVSSVTESYTDDRQEIGATHEDRLSELEDHPDYNKSLDQQKHKHHSHQHNHHHTSKNDKDGEGHVYHHHHLKIQISEDTGSHHGSESDNQQEVEEESTNHHVPSHATSVTGGGGGEKPSSVLERKGYTVAVMRVGESSTN